MVLRADRDHKWREAYETIANTLRRIDMTAQNEPWFIAAHHLLSTGLGLTRDELGELGCRTNNYRAVLEAHGETLIGYPIQSGRRGRPRVRFYYESFYPKACA